jgi:hypothetical protein
MSQNTKIPVTRSISAIARDIRADWGSKVNYAAQPYLQAMLSIDEHCPNYGHDSGENIVRYFLCNAAGYRGGKAKALKSELRTVCGWTK